MTFTTVYGVELTVEAALAASTGNIMAWNSALWNAAVWGPDDLFTDISEYVVSLSTARRFSRDLQAWEAGVASLVLQNADGRFSPSNLDSPYVTGGITQIRPWRPIRILAHYNGATYPIYRGYAMDFDEFYVEPSPEGGGAYVSVPCVDEWAALAGFGGLQVTPVGAGETSGRRVHRLLDAAGHTGNRDIDQGVVTLQATDLSRATDEELRLTADSEGGAIYIDADGTVKFEDQFALIENTRSNTVQAVYGDAESEGELSYTDIDLGFNGDLVVNIAAFQRVGGTVQMAADAESRALNRDRRFTRSDLLCETDVQVAVLAQTWVARYKDPEQRVKQLTFKPSVEPDLFFPDLLSRKVRDRVRVKRRPPGGYTISRDCFVAGISHDITGDRWITTLDLWSATPYTGFSASLWNTAVWDSSQWFF